jgi:hypothetical protein
MTCKWRIAGDIGAEEFLDEIAEYLVEHFGVSLVEARARIEAGWAHFPEGHLTLESESLVFHEEASYWAHNFYYGSSSFWWITGEARQKHGLPPLIAVAPSDIHGSEA